MQKIKIKIKIMIYGATQERAERKLKLLLETLKLDYTRYERTMPIIRELSYFIETDEYILEARKYFYNVKGYRYHIVYMDEMLDVIDEQYNTYIRGNIIKTILNHNNQIYKFRFSDD